MLWGHFCGCCCFCLLKRIQRIHHFHNDHNAPCLPQKRLPSRCFQFLLGITVFPREIDGYFLLLSFKFVFVSLSGSRLVRILSIWVFSCFAFWFRLYLNLVMLSLPNVYFHFEHFYLLLARWYTQVVMFRRLDLTLGFQVLLKFLFGIC